MCFTLFMFRGLPVIVFPCADIFFSVLVAHFVQTDTVSMVKPAEVSCLGQCNTQRGADFFEVKVQR